MIDNYTIERLGIKRIYTSYLNKNFFVLIPIEGSPERRNWGIDISDQKLAEKFCHIYLDLKNLRPFHPVLKELKAFCSCLVTEITNNEEDQINAI